MRENLAKMREKKQEILDESSSGLDGQPKAKYSFGDVVSNKAIRREQIDYSISKIEYEIKTIEDYQSSLVGWERKVYDETIARDTNLTAKADLLGCAKNKLVDDRAKLLRDIAERLGEYVDMQK